MESHLLRAHTPLRREPGRAEGLFLILDSDRLIVPTRKTLSPKLDRGALPDLLLSHTLSSSMSTSFLVVDVTLRRTLSRRIRSSIKNDTKSLREIWAGNVHGEGGREGEAEAAITDDGPRRRKLLFLVDILSFVPTDNPLSSIENERASERARVRQSHRPSSPSRLPSGVWTSANRRTGRRDRAPRLRPPPALPPDGSPFPLRAYAFV